MGSSKRRPRDLRIANEGLAWLDVRPEPQASCNGSHRSPSGRVVTQWPFSMSEFQRRRARPDDAAYEVGTV